MSWISDFAGKAEDLLNRIDNNAASVLNTKEKKKRSAVTETSNVDNPEAQLQIVTSSTPPVTPLSGTGTPRTSLTPKKTKEMSLASSAVQDPLIDLSQDEKLITFLNNPSVVVEDLEVKVDRSETKSTLSSPKKFLYSSLDPGLLQNENEMLTNEVRSLNVEVSLLLGRVKSAEADSLSWRALLTKKDAELNILKNDLASLQQQIKDIQKNNENGFLENERLKKNYKSRNEQTRELEEKLSDLQLEMHKREELFKSDLANMRIRVTELEELMSTSNAQHVKQMSESKLRFEEMRTQFEDYKARARKTLTDKDALIQELKTGNQPSQSESLEVSQLRNELEVISGELEKCESRVELERKRAEDTADRLELLREESAAEVNSVRSQLRQEAERRLAAEENCRQHAEELHKVREDLNKELSAMSDRFREKLNEVASLRRQITQRSDSKPNLSEAKVSTLTQALVQKQTALEAMTNDRNQIRLEMERLKNMYGQCVNHTTVRSNVNDTDDAKAQVPTFMLESPFDTGVARKVKRAYSSLDAVSIRTGMFLRRYPFARILVLCYCICLHLWVCLVLFSNTPDTKI